MLNAICDSKESTTKYIKDLKTLHEVMDVRHDAYYNHKTRLTDFKISNGFIWFDTCGNTLVKIPKDNSYSKFESYSPIKIPNENDVCPFCGKGFNIYHLDDYFENNNGEFFHKQCNLFNNLDIQRKEFISVFKNIYNISDIDFKAIPNQYDNWEGYTPWFIVNTPDGYIKIGWRKRVIQIEWLSNYQMFSDKFEQEDVTKEFDSERYIHAWSIDKCIEYLLRVKNSITK